MLGTAGGVGKIRARMRAVAAGVTDVGRERDHNEDRFVLVPECEVFVVADGMGGHQCGEVASRMAASIIASYFRSERDNEGASKPTPEVLEASLLEANKRIHRRATSSPTHRGMGTTVVAAAFDRTEKLVHLAHAGDSRCYRLRDGALEQLTHDHSLIEEALRARPDISRSELAYLPSNVITRALGVESKVEVELTHEEAMPGDVLLLCTDGLHGFVTDERLAEIMRATPILTEACSALVAEANKNGGGDNITAVLVRIEPGDEPWAVAGSVPPAPRTSAIPPGSESAAAGDDASESGAQVVDDTARLPAVLDPDAVLRAPRAPRLGQEGAAREPSPGAADDDEDDL